MRQLFRKNLMCPESSFPVHNFLKPEKNSFNSVNDLDLRPRSIHLKVGVLAKVKGSAYMEYGKTKLIASVESPREINKQQKKSGSLGVVTCVVKYAKFASAEVDLIPRKENVLSGSLKKALESVICRHEFPNFELEIKVLVLDDDGCALSTAITCCGVALVDAGIPTYDLVAASTVSFYKGFEIAHPNNSIESFISLDDDEDSELESGIVVVASLSSIGQITECFQKGYLSQNNIEIISSHALEANHHLFDTIRKVLLDKIEKKN